ncbi:MAG TPA: hypothetical protein VEK57_07700 [Thermoanaerobaculia bacterium]|nr:hypothetical protein [Thermoanaerobaculia bacterium]
MGPTEERGFAVWAGYELAGIEDDLSAIGLIRVDDWPEERIAAHGIATFTRIEPGDEVMYAKLGIPAKQ